jgi:hypothetical protein
MNKSASYNYLNKIKENSNQNKWLRVRIALCIDKSQVYRDFSALIPQSEQCFKRFLILMTH